jgi:hypothetical protein
MIEIGGYHPPQHVPMPSQRQVGQQHRRLLPQTANDNQGQRHVGMVGQADGAEAVVEAAANLLAALFAYDMGGEEQRTLARQFERGPLAQAPEFLGKVLGRFGLK